MNSRIDRFLSWLGERILPRSEVPAPRSDGQAVRALVRSLRPWEGAHPLIRLGPDGDGGYLVPDDLEGITACFSPGVSRISGFERDCAERGMQVYMADASVAGPALEHPAFHFTPRFLGTSTHGKFVTLPDWIRESIGDAGGDLLLQMDIESHEYPVLLATPDALLERFRIIVIEFHLLPQLWNLHFLELVQPVFERLLRSHACVHVHPNNYSPPVVREGITLFPFMEFTFHRRDRVGPLRPATRFPHPLDRDNTRRPTAVLPRSWYAD
jgi:hypothetical protein